MHYTTSGRHFLATEDRKDSAAGPSQRMYLAESSAEASAEHSRQLATLTKNNKTKRSVHHRSRESKKRTRKSSTVESTGRTEISVKIEFKPRGELKMSKT